ncbi:hypothetical protein Pelo_19041 [Pelomyxa schiedti]|nr:hypothetical protein Pelo_19041 [Pelomyxa schiedti]
MEFVQIAKRCGIPQRPTRPQEIDECAIFLADIGTIVHFKYPSWSTELVDLVILEPPSFLTKCAPPLALGLRAIVKDFFNRKPGLVNIGDLNENASTEKGYLSFLPSQGTVTASHRFKLRMDNTAPTALSGRFLKFPMFPQELFFKAFSRFRYTEHTVLSEWTCLHDGILLSRLCSHSRKLHLLITSQDDIVSLYMREECNNEKCFPLDKRAQLWAHLIHSLCDLVQSIYEQFEEKSEPLFPAAVVEFFACPRCLKKSDYTAFPPHLCCFSKEDILKAVNKGEKQLTCGNGIQVDVAAIAPEIVEPHNAAMEIVSGKEPPMSEPSTPTILYASLPTPIIKNITLGQLLSLLIENGAGTTSVLDPVLPVSLRLKMLFDVAKGLKSFHGHKPPIAHGKLTPGVM